MKFFLLFVLQIYYTNLCLAQNLSQPTEKPPIDTSVLGSWPYVSNAAISDNGHYAFYKVINNPRGSNTLVVLSTDSTWTKKFIIKKDEATSVFFSGDGKQVVFNNSDTLFFVTLGGGQSNFVLNVLSFKQSAGGANSWLAYQLNNPSKDLVLRNLLTGKERRFPSVDRYTFDDYGNTLLLISDSSHVMQWINLSKGTVIPIWSSLVSTIVDYNFDISGKQLVFTEQKKVKDKEVNFIWYYKKGLNRAEMCVSNQSIGIEPGISLNGSPRFSKSGRWIFFQLEQSLNKIKPKPDAVMVDIWSYKDVVIQPEQMRLDQWPNIFVAAMRINDNKVIRLEEAGEQLLTSPDQVTGKWVVIKDNRYNNEYWWNLSPQPSFYLMSLENGFRRLLKKESKSIYNFSFSPAGKYLVYYDMDKESYFSCNTITGKIINITASIPSKVSSEYIRSIPPDAVAATAGWGKRDETLLIYDNYDIWEVAVGGNRLPINVTNGYGLAHHIKFRLVDDSQGFLDESSGVFDRKSPLLLTAFNISNKHNGFYKQVMNHRADPQLLMMGAYTFYRVSSQKASSYGSNGMKPLKAKRAYAWIVQRQSAISAPNYFFTRDFKTYKRLSNFQPQTEYNWLTAELVTWKMLDGLESQGILYKPENFDSTKKYPVIFNYYEKLSHRLYEFPQVAFTDANINIPWFVSNGYLVFTPDIHFAISKESNKVYGEWAYNSVVSAAQYLAKLPFVDAKRMAIQGHSFGGGETNYIVTHTNIFAAAAEAAGVSDDVSRYLTLVPFGSAIEHYSSQGTMERSHQLTGATLWQRPDLYQKSSAVLSADKITTPLLIMHNKKDNQIPWRQGVEFYMALRRLGKRAWMLQYDNGGHSLGNKEAVDYTIRLTQFFDHYLKERAAPFWMTKGVPAKLKGVQMGYELDGSQEP